MGEIFNGPTSAVSGRLHGTQSQESRVVSCFTAACSTPWPPPPPSHMAQWDKKKKVPIINTDKSGVTLLPLKVG